MKKEDRKKRSYFEYCLLSFIKENKEYFLDDIYNDFFKDFSGKDKINNKFKYNIERSVTYLIAKDSLNLKMKNNKNYIVLSKKGVLRREFLKNIFESSKNNLKNIKSTKKDCLYILIFNFDKNKKNTRDYIKTIVKNQGFKRVRDGVWSTEYELGSFVEAIRDRYELKKDELIFGEFNTKS